MVLHDLWQSDQTLPEDMRARHRNVSDVLRRECRTLGRILGIDLIRRRHDLHLFVQLLRVVQCEGGFVGPGVEGERFAREKEEALLANFYFVVSGRKIAEREASRAVCFRAVRFSTAMFKLYLGGTDRDAILVHHDTRALGRIHCEGTRRRKNANGSKDYRK